MSLAGGSGSRTTEWVFIVCAPPSHSLLGPAVLVDAATLGEGPGLRGRHGG